MVTGDLSWTLLDFLGGVACDVCSCGSQLYCAGSIHTDTFGSTELALSDDTVTFLILSRLHVFQVQRSRLKSV